MEWQPIETAPKDGTLVDLWVQVTETLTDGSVRHVGCHRRTDAWWHKVDAEAIADARQALPETWSFEADYFGTYSIEPVCCDWTSRLGNTTKQEATHWMPLPEPPNA